jgi:hypothetical protein
MCYAGDPIQMLTVPSMSLPMTAMKFIIWCVRQDSEAGDTIATGFR